MTRSCVHENMWEGRRLAMENTDKEDFTYKYKEATPGAWKSTGRGGPVKLG